MSAASVLSRPQYNISYYDNGDNDVLTTIGNVVTTNISAYIDNADTVYDLRIGASSNIVAAAVDNIFLNHGASNSVVLSTHDGAETNQYMSLGMVNDRIALTDINNSGIDIDATDVRIGRTRFIEGADNMTISMPALNKGLIVTPPVAMQSTLAVAYDTSLHQNLFVSGECDLRGRLVSYGGVYTPDIALFKSTPSVQGAAQVGYTWKINDNDQLELVKYTFFDSDTTAVSKRVAVFGNAAIRSTDTSDVNYSASRITTESASSGSGTGGSGGGGTGGDGSVVGAAAFSVSSSGGLFTSTFMAIGTDETDSTVSLLVNGTTQTTTLVATTNVSSPAFLTTSDERLKDIHNPISGPDALSSIMRLSPLTYSWKDDDSQKRYAGFTAQGIEAQIPIAVQMVAGKTIDALHIDNTALLAYLVAAVKEIGARLAL